MKKLLVYSSIAAIVALSFSCKRLLDKIDKLPTSKVEISKMSYETGTENERITYFNSQGEPTLSIPKRMGTGYPWYEFQYNQKGYLTHFVYFFNTRGDGKATLLKQPTGSPNNLFIYHAYSHDAYGKILTDTVYYAGNGTPYTTFSITTYTYDINGRILSDSFEEYYGNLPYKLPVVKTYSYNSSGNLNGQNYGDKLNVNTLSKVLPFLARDYSVNNLLQDEMGYIYEYLLNNLSLPTSVKGAELPEILIPRFGGTTSIEYTYR